MKPDGKILLFKNFPFYGKIEFTKCSNNLWRLFKCFLNWLVIDNLDQIIGVIHWINRRKCFLRSSVPWWKMNVEFWDKYKFIERCWSLSKGRDNNPRYCKAKKNWMCSPTLVCSLEKNWKIIAANNDEMKNAQTWKCEIKTFGIISKRIKKGRKWKITWSIKVEV